MRNLATAITVLLLATAPAALAQEQPQPPHISVTGEGSVSARPDTAIVTMTIMRQAASARAALDENNAATASVIDALKESGIKSQDLQTSGFSISPQYKSANNGSGRDTSQIVAYRVSNTLTARIRKLDDLGRILDQSVSLGVNQGGAVAFTLNDPSEVLAEARTKAMQDAIAKARTLTKAAKIGLGKILEISEQSIEPRPIPLAGVRVMAAEAVQRVPVESGEDTYQVHVNVTFELEQ